MEDNRISVLDRLAAADPAPTALGFDQARADRVLATILSEPRPERRVRPRRKWLAAVAVAVVAVGIATPALSVSGVRSMLDFRNPPVLEESKLLVSAPVADRTIARLWASPSKSGGECVFMTFGPPGEVAHPPDTGGDGACSRNALRGTWTFLSITPSTRPLVPKGAAAWVPPVISGALDPDLETTRVEVRWSGGSKELAFAGGFFLGAVEGLYEAGEEALPFVLVAYDADGREVMRRSLRPLEVE